MDDATVELLSRYLDGDLGDEERTRLERLLEEDAAARSELEGLRRLRLLMAELADREQPPPELDALLEPLRRTAPTPQLVRPAYRWLAAAASVLVAIGVAYQVARQSPAPAMPTASAPLPSPAAHQTEPRPSAPSQTRPEGDRAEELVGAADRLLASPLPEPEVDRPPPLDVLGPLEAPRTEQAPPPSAPAAARSVSADTAVTAVEGEAELRQVERRSGERGQWAPEPAREAARPGGEPAVATNGVAARSKRISETAAASLEVIVHRDRVTVPIARLPDLEAGSYALLLEVAEGVIEACRPARDASPTSEWACSAVVGTAVGDLSAGAYQGWLHVPDLRPR